MGNADRPNLQVEVIRSDADSALAAFTQSDKCDRQLCLELGKLYVQGATYNWERLYKQERRRRVSFPTYPFDRYRCWVKPSDVRSNENAGHEGLAANRRDEQTVSDIHQRSQSSFYHQRKWCPEPLASSNRRSWERQGVLIFHDEHIAASALIRQWGDSGATVIAVVMGEHYERINDLTYIIRDEPGDYEQLLLDTANVSVHHIIDLRFMSIRAEAENLAGHKQSLEQSIYKFYRLAHALTRRTGSESIEMTIVSSYGDEVIHDQARVQPEQYAMIGLSKAIGWENPHIRIRWIDLDEQTDSAQVIWSELEVPANDYWIAYRQGTRYLERVDELQVEEQRQDNRLVEYGNEGVYVITGGLGSIGLLIAEHFVKEAKDGINIALMGRSVLPPEEQWSDLVNSNLDKRIIRAIRAIRGMKELGANVEVIAADTSNEEQLSAALTELRQRYSRIAGIVHAAGVAEGNVMNRLLSDELRAVITAKTTGTWLLDHLTREDQPDFFVLFSSAITLIGGIGSGPYTAGNAYLDGYSAYRNRLGLPTLTINWPAWEDSDVAGNTDVDESKEMFYLMSAEQGIRAFQLLLKTVDSQPLRQVFVGNWNHKSHLFALGELLPFRQSEQLQQAHTSSLYSTKSKSTGEEATAAKLAKETASTVNPVAGTHDEIEQVVTKAWKLVLGYEELDINANFFEIGGDSILITKVHHYIEEAFPSLTTIADLFSYPTIARMTSHLFSVVASRFGIEKPEPESMEADSFEEEILVMFTQMKRGDLSIDDAVDRFHELEVVNG